MRVPGAQGRAALLLWVLAAVAAGPGRAPGGEGPPPAAAAAEAAEAGAGGGLAHLWKGAELTPADVLDHGRRATGDPGEKRFAGPVLGYVTPWNARGYEVAERYAAKFTHLAPVWFQLKAVQATGDLHVAGQHEVNQTWLAGLRAGPRPPKVVPRVLFELGYKDTLQILMDKDRGKASRTVLYELMKTHGLDGLVLEVWTQWAALEDILEVDEEGEGTVTDKEELRRMMLNYLAKLAKGLHKMNPPRELILAVPPAIPTADGKQVFEPETFDLLADRVDGFSVMTYDAASGLDPGANAPLAWVGECLSELLTRKSCSADGTCAFEKADAAIGRRVLVGMNFYGNEYMLSNKRGRDIVGREFIRILRKETTTNNGTLLWDKEAHEHVFKYGLPNVGSDFEVWYPTPRSVHARMDLAASWGAGLAIWEVGQGLDWLFDLL